MKHVKEIIAEAIFLISALASIFAVAMICFFLFANGLPAIFKIGPLKFLKMCIRDRQGILLENGV